MFRGGFDMRHQNSTQKALDSGAQFVDPIPQMNRDKNLAEESTLDQPLISQPAQVKRTSDDIFFENWARYHKTGFLGKGGMGRVYLAWDPRLKRTVAIKLIDHIDPQTSARFLREARLQATVDHPHVCQVYEAGSHNEKAFIVMQFIDGRDLYTATKDMNLEGKLRLMLQVIHCLGEAHRLGLIHRDIKPGNILVKGCNEGKPHAYLLDFGLARDLTDTTMTRTGELMGTPAYMAPEQALGEIRQLDRRTDIYSLGATMYKLLGDKPPFEGKGSLDILNSVIAGEPLPLRKVVPSIPRDVETIVMKCLEKRRSDRYGSTRELAQDLTSYLNGETIKARPAPFSSLLLKKLRKHKAVVAIAAVASVLLVASLVWGLHTQRQGAIREALVHNFTSRVEKIGALGRFMHMSQPHDLTRDRQLILDQMAAVEQEMIRVGDIGKGPGHYALGKGAMALDQMERAQHHLQRAWDAGFQEPRVADALSQVLGERYKDELTNIWRVELADQRDQRLQQIKAQYRDPAIHYANLGKADSPQPGFAQALLSFYEGDYDRAHQLLAEIEEKPTWFYEKHKLAGDIWLAKGSSLVHRDKKSSVEAFAQAGIAYKKAIEEAPSDPALYESLAKNHYAQMEMNLYLGEDIEPSFAKGIAVVELAEELDPDSIQWLIFKSDFFCAKGEHLRNRSQEEAGLWLQRAKEVSLRVVQNDPNHDLVNQALGRTCTQLAQLEAGLGKDPGENVAQALSSFNAVGAAYRSGDYFNYLGLAHKTAADHLAQRGGDFRESRKQEVAAYAQAVALNPNDHAPLINKASALLSLADESPDSLHYLEEGLSAIEQAQTLAPKHIATLYYAARLNHALTNKKYQLGKPHEHHYAQAAAIYQRGAEIHQRLPHFQNGLAGLYLDQSRINWRLGRNPEPTLASALYHGNLAFETAPRHFQALVNIGETLITRTEFRLYRGVDPGTDLNRAEKTLAQALSIAPNVAQTHALIGELWRLRAVDQRTHGKNPSDALQQAHNALARGLAINEKDPYVLKHLARTYLLQAQLAHAQKQPWKPHMDSAYRVLEDASRAGVIDLLIEVARINYQHLLLCAAGCSDTALIADRGLAAVQQALDLREDGEAIALGVGFKYSRLQSDTVEPNTAQQLKSDLDHALQLNNNLTPKWFPLKTALR